VLNQWLQEQLWAEDFYFQQVEFALGQGNVPSIEEVDEALLSPETADERMQQFAAVHPRLQGDIEGYKNWLLQEFIPLYDEVVAEREQTAENTAQKQEEETNGQEEAEQVQEITVTIDQLQTDLTQLSSQLDEHSEALRDVSFQFSVVDVRFDGLNGRLDGLNGQLAAIIAQLSSLGAQLGRLTDPYTAPERQAEPLPGTTVITQ
jgi:chromosome segregation ATPase